MSLVFPLSLHLRNIVNLCLAVPTLEWISLSIINYKVMHIICFFTKFQFYIDTWLIWAFLNCDIFLHTYYLEKILNIAKKPNYKHRQTDNLTLIMIYLKITKIKIIWSSLLVDSIKSHELKNVLSFLWVQNMLAIHYYNISTDDKLRVTKLKIPWKLFAVKTPYHFHITFPAGPI